MPTIIGPKPVHDPQANIKANTDNSCNGRDKSCVDPDNCTNSRIVSTEVESTYVRDQIGWRAIQRGGHLLRSEQGKEDS